MKKIILIAFFAFCSFLHAVAASAALVNDVKINTNAEKIEVFLKLQGSYDKKPRITIENQYKGVIFSGLSALRKNEIIRDSFLSEVQIFELSNSLYVLGIGDPQIVDVQISRSADTYKIDFVKIPKKPTHLDILMDKALNAPIGSLNAKEPEAQTFQNPALNSQDSVNSQNSAQSFSESILNLPAPQDSESAQVENSQSPLLTQAALANVAKNAAQNIADSEIDLSKLNTQGNLIDSWRYFALAGLLALMILALLLIKKFMSTPSSKLQNAQNADFLAIFKNTENIKIIAQKKIDPKSKIVTIHANGIYYLVLMSDTSAILLDRFSSDGTRSTDMGSVAAQNIKAANEKTQMPSNLVIEDSSFAKLLEQKEQRLKRLKDEQDS